MSLAIGRGILDLLVSLVGIGCGGADIVSVEGVAIVGDADPKGRGILELLDPVAGVDFGVVGTFIVSADGAKTTGRVAVISLLISIASPCYL